MKKNESSRNRIKLPAIGAEIFTYLKDVNDRESFTASRRLKDLLTSNLKVELAKYFPDFLVVETSQSTLRKVTNSLLSAGTSGNSRTLDALQEIGDLSKRERGETHFLRINKDLRDWSKDYRSAKGALDNNFKCINSFLRVQKTSNDESIRYLLKSDIASYSDFASWNQMLRDYWTKKQFVKVNLQGAYLAIYDAFIRTFDEDLSNVKLYSYLDITWLRYLSPEQKALYETSSTPTDFQNSNESIQISSTFDIELEIGGGRFDYLIRCYSLNQYQASQLQFKLALELSRAKQFPALSFRVSHRQDESPIIVVAVKGLQDESDVSNIVQFLENALAKAKSTH